MTWPWAVFLAASVAALCWAAVRMRDPVLLVVGMAALAQVVMIAMPIG